MILDTIIVPMALEEQSLVLPVQLMPENEEHQVGLETAIVQGERVEYYEGPYSFTPSAQAQTIPVNHLMASQDITIEPVPQQYGLITYNGSTITVS